MQIEVRLEGLVVLIDEGGFAAADTAANSTIYWIVVVVAGFLTNCDLAQPESSKTDRGTDRGTARLDGIVLRLHQISN